MKLFAHVAMFLAFMIMIGYELNQSAVTPTILVYAAIVCIVLLVVFRRSYLRPTLRKSSPPDKSLGRDFGNIAIVFAICLPVVFALRYFDLLNKFFNSVWGPLGTLSFMSIAVLMLTITIIREKMS